MRSVSIWTPNLQAMDARGVPRVVARISGLLWVRRQTFFALTPLDLRILAGSGPQAHFFLVHESALMP